MTNHLRSLPQDDAILVVMERLRQKLSVVPTERADVRQALGRYLAQDIKAFRDSPSLDVSAMDGYAVRLEDIDGNALKICGVATAGSPPIDLIPKSAVRVFTGGPVPTQAQCVVKREDCNESESYVSICLPRNSLSEGMNIRRRGENARVGKVVLRNGQLLIPSRYAGAVTFLESNPLEVYRRVRVGIINTGDELIDFGNPIQSWQIRDSNGPFLESMLARHHWIEFERTKVADDEAGIQQVIEDHLKRFDVVLLTGGVSMGDTDFVPDSIRSSGGHVVFHRIPIRPGKPMLGAVGPSGQLILGLPGNPLSVAVTFRRFAMGLMRHVAGAKYETPVPSLELVAKDAKTIPLTWFRLVWMESDGRLTLVDSQGSGDIASLVESSGFVEIPPNCPSAGTWPYYEW